MDKDGSLAQSLVRAPAARLFAVFWTALVVVDVVTVVRAPVDVAIGVMGLVALLASRHQHPATAMAVAAVAWLFFNGFYENRFGELDWHGAADLRVVLVLLAAAAGGSLLRMDGVVTRVRRSPSPARVAPAGVRHPVRIGK